MRVAALTLVVMAVAAGAAQAADPVLVAAGDVACDPASPSYMGGNGTLDPAPGKCHQKYTSDLIAPLSPARVLALGDLQYEDGDIDKFTASYDPSWGRVKAITRPVPGNHEYGSGTNTPGNTRVDPEATGYFTYFAPQLSPLGADATDPQRGWYSYDVQAGSTSWHIVAVNSECAAGLADEVAWEGGCAAGSEQERWLRADLASNTADCTLAYWHHPLFSAAGGSSEMAPVWNALYDDYADVVLAGHRHTYERFAAQDSAGTARPGRGLRSWVVGTGGKEPHTFTLGSLPNAEKRDNTTHGVLKLTLHGPGTGHPYGWYEWQFINDGMSGSTFSDTGSGDCVGPPRPAPVPLRAVADRVAPRLSRPRLSRKRFRVGRGATARSAAVPRGTVIGYTLSEPATTSLRIDRRRRVRGRTRYRRAGTLKRKGKAGRRRVKFSGRIGRKRLAPGVYRVVLTARDTAGNLGKPRKLLFRIVR